MVDFPLVDSPDALLWMVQMHCIDMNAWLARRPAAGRTSCSSTSTRRTSGFPLAVRVANLIHEELDASGSTSYVKTSGADGIHHLRTTPGWSSSATASASFWNRRSSSSPARTPARIIFRATGRLRLTCRAR